MRRQRTGILAATLVLVFAIIASPGDVSANGAPLICLDPGHGGTEPGAVNGSLEEKDINLDVTHAVRSLLIEKGYAVALTRTGDETRSANDRYTFCNQQNATILVSIHTNSSTSDTADGTLAIYFHNDDKVLAAAIQKSAYDTLKTNAPNPDAFLDRGLKRDALGVLLKSNMPAATIEPLFMSHPGEAELLAQLIHEVDENGVVMLDNNGNPTPGEGCTTETGLVCRRMEIAQGIVAGIQGYFAAPPPSGGGGGGGCGSPPCRKQ
jgi:N-acetylmuramoyl-L-alanine amidase